MNNLYPQKTTRKCHECGSSLLLVEKRTETVDGQYAPVTTSIYKCSDIICQEEIDRKRAVRLQLIKEQELARQKRLENIKLNRMKSKIAASKLS